MQISEKTDRKDLTATDHMVTDRSMIEITGMKVMALCTDIVRWMITDRRDLTERDMDLITDLCEDRDIILHLPERGCSM